MPSNPLLRGFGRRSPVNAFAPRLTAASRRRITQALRASGNKRITSYGRLEEVLHGIGSGSFRLVNTRTGRLEGGEAVEAELTSRGRYELRSGRAVHTAYSNAGGRRHAVRTTLGGALRDSVRVGKTEIHGSTVKVSVFAGNKEAYYAKYVEFGTRHAAGQPFLRPALAKMREEFHQRIAREVTKTAQERRPGRGSGEKV